MQTQPEITPLEPRSLPNPGIGQCVIGEEELNLVTEVMKSGLIFRYYGLKPDDKPAVADTFEKEFCEMIITFDTHVCWYVSSTTWRGKYRF